MTEEKQELLNSLTQGFLDSSSKSDGRFVPQLLSNNPEENTTVLSALQSQLAKCERFDFSVAFLTKSGIETIVQLLLSLRERGIPGRILTTTYNNFNDPEALRKLLEFPNIETRVFQGGLHTKGYFFKKGQIHAVIIGSANLTQAALKKNREWNLLLHSYEEGELFQSARREFETLWQAKETVALSEYWISEYESYRKLGKPETPTPRIKSFVSQGIEFTVEEIDGDTKGPDYETVEGFLPARKKPSAPKPQIIPNGMQQKALQSLAALHEEKAERALLISATGTGKTYLSAFDVAAEKPKRILFIAHRKRILEASLRSFNTVLGDKYSYDIISAGNYRSSASCVFAMVSTLVRHLDEFNPLEFDYIIVDESHRAGAESYRKVLSHFAPKFVLGMTATPQRGDNFDIFDLFNHIIAYRITLQDALSEEMLTPFHYYGIADMEIDGAKEDNACFSRLTSQARVDHIIKKIQDYSVSKTDRRGLVFCSRNDEARSLSDEFNKRGFKTKALSGNDSDDQRNRAIADLENGKLEYLFSVDIFNEGVDIPSINQIIMLRPTESVIVFVQQLGRGLRKHENKESVLVLDFIGNYQNNYMIPIALSGDCSYNKDNLRRFIKEGSSILPGCSTINFDRIAEERIFDKLDATKFSNVKLVREEYFTLKNMLGRIPKLSDFDENGAIDPLLIFKCGGIGSYHDFLKKYEKDYSSRFSTTQEQMLRYVSQKLADGKRSEDLIVLKALIETSHISHKELTSQSSRHYQEGKSQERLLKSVAACLTNRFVISQQQKTFSECIFIEEKTSSFSISPAFEEALHNASFRSELLDVIEFGLARNNEHFRRTYKDTNLVLYKKYSYEDVFRILEWPNDVNKQNVGGYMFNEATNTFPVFINYEKDEGISDTTKYEDRFLSNSEFEAISKSRRTLESNEIKRLMQHPSNGMHVYLFVRKNKNDSDGGKEFYFLGEVAPTHKFEQFVMRNSNSTAVRIGYRLEQPVRADIYNYLTSNV